MELEKDMNIIRNRAGRRRRAHGLALLAALSPLPVAHSRECNPWCTNLCEDLSGDIYSECGGCDATFACSPGDGKGAGAEAGEEVTTRVVEPGTYRLDLLWPSAVYSTSIADMDAHNQEISNIVTARFEELFSAQDLEELGLVMVNERFHDSHRPQLAQTFMQVRRCIEDGTRIQACEDATFAESVWPELLNSSGFRALFGRERGLVWSHLRQYLSHVAPAQADALLRGLDFDVWATYHANGIRHGSHSHDGSAFAGVYYVKQAGEDEQGGALRVEDPRHIMLGDRTRRQVTHSELVVRPTPGQLLFWPAYLQHQVTPTVGPSARISLAMDIRMGGSVAAIWPQQVAAAMAEVSPHPQPERSSTYRAVSADDEGSPQNAAAAAPNDDDDAAANAAADADADPDDGSADGDDDFSIRPFVCSGMPTWMRKAVGAFSGDQGFEGASQGAERACPTTGPSLEPRPPSYDGPARPIPRARGLNASTLYWRYVRPGLPVILEGVLGRFPEAEARASAIRQCCEAEYRHKAEAHGRIAPDRCDIYDPDTWCETGVQLCGRHPKFDCPGVAGLDELSRMPAGLRQALEVPPPLPSLEYLTQRWGHAYVFWSRPGDEFGAQDHFDMICTGTLSMQHRGSKRWSLWAPFGFLRDASGAAIPPHALFEGTAHAGDALFYPPAWFHATRVEQEGEEEEGEEEEEEEEEGGESITTAVDLLGFPAFGALANRSLRTPFGYNSCAQGRHGWYAQAHKWDSVLTRPADVRTASGHQGEEAAGDAAAAATTTAAKGEESGEEAPPQVCDDPEKAAARESS